MAPLMDAYYVPAQITGEYKSAIGNWLRGYIARVRKDDTSAEMRRKANERRESEICSAQLSGAASHR